VFQAPASAPIIAPDVREQLVAAIRFYDLGDYQSAMRELRAAYMVDPQPRFLYELAKSSQQTGDCRNTDFFYKAYLRATYGSTDPVVLSQQADAQVQMKPCQAR
jgi:hypothetical protein